jgi:hypothetical protein
MQRLTAQKLLKKPFNGLNSPKLAKARKKQYTYSRRDFKFS